MPPSDSPLTSPSSVSPLSEKAIAEARVAASARGFSRGVLRAEYDIWRGMLRRCLNPQCAAYKHYGGRGINVCEAWRTSFAAFIADVGPRPGRGFSIERKDCNGHYERGNVLWIPRSDQSKNTRANRRIEHNGETRNLDDWARSIGISPSGLLVRLRTMSMEKAMALPVRGNTKKAWVTRKAKVCHVA